MSRPLSRYVGLLLTLILLSLPQLTLAAENNDLDLLVGCDGFVSNGGALLLNRDNTNRNREAFSINAIDGNGRIVYAPITDRAPVGASVSFGVGTTYAWTTRPTANPITLNVISLAGNGLEPEVVYSITGQCEGLTLGTASEDPFAGLSRSLLIVDTTVSPAVEPGENIPVPTSDADAIEVLPGYAIVDTPRLNLRTGDAPEFAVVAVVRGGTRAIVLGRNDNFSWWLLEVGDIRGWANAEFLILRGDLTDVPVLEAEGELTPVTFLTFLPQPVFIEPANLTSNFVCTVVPGEYRVLGRDEFSDYYRIEGDCDNGTTLEAWIELEAGVIRNPSQQFVPVITE